MYVLKHSKNPNCTSDNHFSKILSERGPSDPPQVNVSPSQLNILYETLLNGEHQLDWKRILTFVKIARGTKRSFVTL